MGNTIRCIYCNAEDNLTISDIIPYALTGAKLKKQFVCGLHNSYTNDEFESECIRKLDFIRNHMGFRTRDGNAIKFLANVIIDGMVFNNVWMSNREVFYERQTISDVIDGKKTIAGNLSKMKGINKDAKQVNIADITIQNKFNLMDLFMSQKMKRTIAKIAYEWHCYKNNICEFRDEYKDIVEYILNGKDSSNLVECVIDALTFTTYDKICEMGTNSVFEFVDKKGDRYVIFCLWNIISYKIFVSSSSTPVCRIDNLIDIYKYNFDGTKEKACFGMYSLNGGIDVISKPPNIAFARLHKIYLERLNRLLHQYALSIFTVKNQVDDLFADIIKYKDGDDQLRKIVSYEEPLRVITIIIISKLEDFEYDFGKSFNTNLKEMLKTKELFLMSTEVYQEELQWIKDEYENGNLLSHLDMGKKIFDKAYEKEIEVIDK